MAIAAAKIMRLVNGSLPENALPSTMAGQALSVLFCDRVLAFPAEAHDAQRRLWIAHMRRAWPVTGFTTFPFELVARIQAKDFGMNRVRPVLIFLCMTSNAGVLTDIVAAICGLRRRSLCGC